jgi:selenide,water dikinase
MAVASGVTFEIEVGAIQFLPGALDYAREGAIPGGLKNNRDFAACAAEVAREIPSEIESLLYDPQTSGGLLISLAAPDAARLAGTYQIGRVVERGEKPIRLL